MTGWARRASASASIVFQARILMVLPLVVLLALRTSQPLASQAFNSVVGQLVLAGGRDAGPGLCRHAPVRTPARRRAGPRPMTPVELSLAALLILGGYLVL